MSDASGGSAPAAPASNVATTATITQTGTNNTAPAQGAETIEQVIAAGQAKEAGKAAPQPTEAQKQEIKAAKKKMQLKVHGQEREIEFDPSDEKYMKQMFEKALGADKVFEEGALSKKQITQLVNALQDKNEFWKLAKQAGHNPDDLVNEYVERALADAEKSPEQKEFERVQKELEDLKKEKQTLEEQKLEVEKRRVQDDYARTLENEIDAAFKDSPDIPKSPYTVARMAQTMIAFLDKGVSISAQQAAKIVRQDTARELQEMFNQMPEEAIEKLLGDNNNKRLRERRRSKMKEIKTSSQVKTSGISEIEKQLNKQPAVKQSANDFFKKLR